MPHLEDSTKCYTLDNIIYLPLLLFFIKKSLMVLSNTIKPLKAVFIRLVESLLKVVHVDLNLILRAHKGGAYPPFILLHLERF